MYIIEKKHIDGNGRIILNGLFDEIPREVAIALSFEGEIKVMDVDKTDLIFPSTSKVDSKNRITLPSWIRKDLRNRYGSFGLYLVLDDDNSRKLIARPDK